MSSSREGRHPPRYESRTFSPRFVRFRDLFKSFPHLPFTFPGARVESCWSIRHACEQVTSGAGLGGGFLQAGDVVDAWCESYSSEESCYKSMTVFAEVRRESEIHRLALKL